MKYPSFKGPIIFMVTGLVLTTVLFVIFIIGIVTRVEDAVQVFSGSPVTLEKGSNIQIQIENNPILEDTMYIISENKDGSVTVQFLRDFDVVVAYDILIANSKTDNTIVIDAPYRRSGEVDDELTMIGSIDISSDGVYLYNIEEVEGSINPLPKLSYHYDEIEEVFKFLMYGMLAYLLGIITVIGSVVYFVIVGSSRSSYRFKKEQARLQKEEDEYYKQFQTKNQDSI